MASAAHTMPCKMSSHRVVALRAYQERIVLAALGKNTIVSLPTGTLNPKPETLNPKNPRP